ncbi:hypothetical protein [Ruegeria jejuensis]|uniref:hypothetical protein n=1 Tax=Ruegeria jejuensis TaxID=3233338 RepID=UPI00355C50CB
MLSNVLFQQAFALVFGAAIVVAFSFERFNRPSYEGRYELDKLVALLAPDQLRARRVVMHAFGLYLLALLLLYFFFCGFANLLPLLDFKPKVGATDVPGDGAEMGLGIPPAVSLSVALVMVGLAPSFPILRRLEDSLRFAAHRVAGIPTRILENSRVLRRGQLPFPAGIAPDCDAYLIDAGDWKRIAHYSDCDRKFVTARSDFEQDLRIIFAGFSWIIDEKLTLSNSAKRLRFRQIEEELRARKTRLIRTLDKVSGFDLNGAALPEEEAQHDQKPGPETPEVQQDDWGELSRKVDDLASDFCLLIALYAEHDIILPFAPRKKVKPGKDNQVLRDSVHQHDEAMSVLRNFTLLIDDFSAGKRSGPGHTGATFIWATCTIVLMTIIWSLYPGKLEYELRFGEVQSWNSYPIRHQLFDAVVNFCVPLLVGLGIRDSGRISDSWANLWESRWPVALIQILVVFLLAWFVSMLIVTGTGIWFIAMTESWEFAGYHLATQIEYESILKMRGAALAVVVLYVIDVFSRDQYSGQKTITPVTSEPDQTENSVAPPEAVKPVRHRLRDSFRWAFTAALIVGFLGALGRSISLLVAAREAPIPRPGLDAIDGGLIFYSTTYSALIAFAVTLMISEVLRDGEAARKIRRIREEKALA